MNDIMLIGCIYLSDKHIIDVKIQDRKNLDLIYIR